MPSDGASPARTVSAGTLARYALACVGGAVAYVPVLTLLVPLKVEVLAADTRVEVLSAVTLAGAVAASVAGVGFGWASDRSFRANGSRRMWMAGGVVAIAAALLAIGLANSPAGLVAAIVGFQFAVNLFLAPLAAVMADAIPDAQKGIVGVLAALSAPVASAATFAITAALPGEGGRLGLVAVIVALAALPLLVAYPPPVPTAAPPPDRIARRGDVLRLSVARFLVQVAGTSVFTYLLFFFETLRDAARTDLALGVARLTLLAYLAATPVGLVAGRWSDRVRQRKPFLLAAALVAALGLAAMASSAGTTGAALGFGVYIVAGTVFLGLQTGLVVQALPSPTHRGRDLGLVNLANTLPAFVGAALAWGIVGPFGYPALLFLLSALVALGGALSVTVRSQA